jgi:hypothetical protein
MESIIDYLKRKLREAGAGRWEAIAVECGVAKTLPRKIAYDDRDNPGVQTIQPLLDFFGAIERGEKTLPEKETVAVGGDTGFAPAGESTTADAPASQPAAL